MLRPNKIWFRMDIGWWMVTISGKRIHLAEGREKIISWCNFNLFPLITAARFRANGKLLSVTLWFEKESRHSAIITIDWKYHD